TVSEEQLALIAEEWGLEPSDSIIAAMRAHVLRGRAEAYRLASHFLDDDVQGSVDPVATLMDKRRKPGEPLTFSPQVRAAAGAPQAEQPVAKVATTAPTQPGD